MNSFQAELQSSNYTNNIQSVANSTTIQDELVNLFEYMALVDTYQDYQYCYENKEDYVD